MSIDFEKLQESLCQLMCADVRLIQRKGRVLVSTPFLFPDGARVGRESGAHPAFREINAIVPKRRSGQSPRSVQ